MRPNLAAPRREDAGRELAFRARAEAGRSSEIVALSWCRRMSPHGVCF